MKQRKMLFPLSLFLLAMLAGCSNEFEDVFNSDNKDAILPVETLDADSDLAVLRNDYPRMKALVISIIGEASMSSAPSQTTRATIINHSSELKAIVSPNGDEWQWPDIDFEKYSLLVGCYEVVHSNIFAANQRILQKKDGLVLYLELRPREDVVGYTFGDIKYFATLFPKLPDLPVEVRRWDNY